MVPGMDHCSILPGKGPDQFDFLTVLENWVEKGEAPDRIIGEQLDKDKKEVVSATEPPEPDLGKLSTTADIARVLADVAAKEQDEDRMPVGTVFRGVV